MVSTRVRRTEDVGLDGSVGMRRGYRDPGCRGAVAPAVEHSALGLGGHLPPTYSSAVSNAIGVLQRGLSSYVQQQVDGWRTGIRGSQVFVTSVLWV